MSRSLLGFVSAAGLFAGIMGVMPGAAQAQASLANGGSALAAAEPGAGPGAQLITHDQAAADYSAAASGMATWTDGFEEALTANDAPGSDRLAMNNEPDKLVTTEGEVRVNQLLDHQLYSTSGEQIGLIKDVLIARGGEPQLIVQASDHLVAVPWSKLYFGLPGAVLHGRPVLPGGSEQELDELPAYSLTGANG